MLRFSNIRAVSFIAVSLWPRSAPVKQSWSGKPEVPSLNIQRRDPQVCFNIQVASLVKMPSGLLCPALVQAQSEHFDLDIVSWAEASSSHWGCCLPGIVLERATGPRSCLARNCSCRDLELAGLPRPSSRSWTCWEEKCCNTKELVVTKKGRLLPEHLLMKDCNRDTVGFWKVFPLVFLITLAYGMRMCTLLSCNNT